MDVEPENYDPHTKTHEEITLPQLTLFLLWIGATLYYTFRVRKRENGANSVQSLDISDVEKIVQNSDSTQNHEKAIDIGGEDKPTTTVQKPSSGPITPSLNSFLQHVFIFGLVMAYFYLSDYKKLFPILHKEYSRDVFLFLVFLVFLISCTFSIKPTADTILGRDQTEEWKGWMQIMFVWYHYFAAKEWYNWIRVYIACYVWMTGFGNFSFFWIKKDFSMWRMLKMLFRLNFLVIFVCIVTKNEYILYYICAMHTYWFFSVYFFMRVLSSWNEHRIKMAMKFGAYIVFNALLFEIPGAVAFVFRPLWFIFQYHDGKHDIMHEWQFRLGLDHWACLIGMLCAYNYPHFEALIKYLEDISCSPSELLRKRIIRVGMIVTSIAACIIWYFTIAKQDKWDYNKLHPYTSFVPILAYIVLRNSFPILRRYHVHIFAWLGKITLETYLSQLHIYLQSNAKDLLAYFFLESPNYRLLNFSLATIVYIALSYVLFKITNNFSSFLIPKDFKLIFRYICIGAACFMISFTLAAILKFSHIM
ncbi:hypothetical protein SNE40_021409 [Patella caerulea]|uniref:Cas1p 10 TM acyl transferase domain-containing protein n=1 Tax=Patella caerulea TaxID=87958 RepID=A0AAN8FZI0_PATCE